MDKISVEELLEKELEQIEDAESVADIRLTFELLKDSFEGIGEIIKDLEEAVNDEDLKTLTEELTRQSAIHDNLADMINCSIGKNIIPKLLG